MRKIIFSLTMLATFLLGASTVEAQNYPFEKIYTQNLQFHCGGYNRVTNVSLYESPATDGNCSTKKMKIVFDLEGYSVIKKFNYKFVIYKTSAITTSFQPIYSGEIYKQFAINSFSHEFELPAQSASVNQMYFIQFDDMGLPNSCYAPNQITSPNFSINWKNLPNNGANRNFGLDGNFAYDTAPRVKCAGDNMVLKLADEVVESLNCTYQIITGYPTPPVACNGAYAGFIITKTDANWTPIDAPKYIGTQGFADAEGVNGSPNFLLENFTDPNTGLAKNIHLLDVFNQYMNNNYGYYNIQLKYANYCGNYQDNMQIMYGVAPVPEVKLNTPSPTVVTSSTSFSNPFAMCQGSGISFNVPPNIPNTNSVNMVLKRYDHNSSDPNNPDLEAVAFNVTVADWNAVGNITSLESLVKGMPVNDITYEIPFDIYNSWSFAPSMITWLPQALVNQANANKQDIYKLEITYSTDCGSEMVSVWFSLISVYCKTGGNNISDNSISSVQSKIYPNPVADELNISYISLQENTTITIRDILGKIVYMENVKNKNLAINQKIDVSTLEKGMYFIEFESINGREQLKFMK